MSVITQRRGAQTFFEIIVFVMLLGAPLHAAMPPAAGDAKPQHFWIDQVVENDWGKLITVYDQPTYQRFTFESDSQVTILHVGLVWDNKEGTYRPNVRQIIHLVKKKSPDTQLAPPQEPNPYDG